MCLWSASFDPHSLQQLVLVCVYLSVVDGVMKYLRFAFQAYSCQ